MKHKLTARYVAGLKLTTEGQVFIWDLLLLGFGIVVGKTVMTWTLQTGGKRYKLGNYPPMTVAQARQRAGALKIAQQDGKDISHEMKGEITLKRALAEHVEALRTEEASPLTISYLEEYLPRILAPLMDRPLASIDKATVKALFAQLTKDHGDFAANRSMKAFRAVWNGALKREDDFTAINPVVAITFHKEHRTQSPLAWDALPAWRERIRTLDPVKEDFLLFVLFTGLRSEDAATIRWDELDVVKGTLFRPCPKGGEEKAFTVPLSTFALEVLQRRRAAGTGSPYVFAGVRGLPIRERTWGRKGASPHRLRDTFATAALESEVPFMNVKVLMNHSRPGGDTTAGYMLPSVEYLRPEVEKIGAFLEARLAGCPGSQAVEKVEPGATS